MAHVGSGEGCGRPQRDRLLSRYPNIWIYEGIPWYV